MCGEEGGAVASCGAGEAWGAAEEAEGGRGGEMGEPGCEFGERAAGCEFGERVAGCEFGVGDSGGGEAEGGGDSVDVVGWRLGWRLGL